jgi:hypothetical protein
MLAFVFSDFVDLSNVGVIAITIQSLLWENYWGHKIKEDELCGICDTYGGEEKYMQVFVGVLEELGIYGRIKIKWVKKNRTGGYGQD